MRGSCGGHPLVPEGKHVFLQLENKRCFCPVSAPVVCDESLPGTPDGVWSWNHRNVRKTFSFHHRGANLRVTAGSDPGVHLWPGQVKSWNWTHYFGSWKCWRTWKQELSFRNQTTADGAAESVPFRIKALLWFRIKALLWSSFCCCCRLKVTLLLCCSESIRSCHQTHRVQTQ